MGIFNLGEKAANKLLQRFAVNAAAVVNEKAIAKVEKKIEESQTKDQLLIEEYKLENPNYERLKLVEKRGGFREQYSIYDDMEQLRFVAKGEYLSKKHHIHIFDPSGKHELGMVKEKLLAVRGPLVFGDGPKDFEFFVQKKAGSSKLKSLGKMKTNVSLKKRIFSFNFNSWVVTGDFFGRNYEIKDGNKIIMKVKETWGSRIYEPYSLDIMNKENEFLCLLVAIAIDAAATTKKEENEFAAKKIKRQLNPFSTNYK